MRNITKLFSIFFVGILLVNCSGDDKADPSVIPALIVTTSAENVTGLDVTLNGKVTQGSAPIQNFGFCVSSDINPTLNDHSYYASGSTGNYSLTITSTKPNSTFHVRAFVSTTGGVYYGNDITYTSAFPVTSVLPTDILPKSVEFRGNVLSLPENTGFVNVGYCFNTQPNPTVANQNFPVGGVGQFSNNINGLQPNTNYYARPYCQIDGQYYYGAEITFKTTGYFGPGGGYVVYDKGDDIDGWRYLEIYPQMVNPPGGTGAAWGCNSTFLSGTYPEMGKGQANTQRIISSCATANTAARLCDNYTRNGYSDWFLGSRDEMLSALNALKSINVMLDTSWTSTEVDDISAYYVSYESWPDAYETGQITKGYNARVYPMRRY